MITIFIGGHGRQSPFEYKHLPLNVSIKWYGEIGKSVSKMYAKQVLNGSLNEIAETKYGGMYVEHYLCETLDLEANSRLQAFQLGPWNSNTYMIQPKPPSCIKLSDFIIYAQKRWPSEQLDIRWAVCRTSTSGGASLTHDFQSNVGEVFKISDGKRAASPINSLTSNVNNGTVWLTQWKSRLVKDYFSPIPSSSF
ncbi:hypothetical protein HQQ94_07375 [Shewanella sp. VB17]|uniref:putative adhesin n=1 Tax=Shewanella sp. VB17 TaxID=2739432 RepID=UPI001564EC46|nr:hypothetical protein [Shewanella sp. VB17]NRD73063.1 hypothetical protein [Shewanella sp. VB17]